MNKEVLTTEDISNLIANHIEKMGELERASVQYFIETGKVNGSFRLRLIAMLKFCEWKTFDAAMELQLPVKFVEWYNSEDFYFIEAEIQDSKDAFNYWLENVYEPEK